MGIDFSQQRWHTIDDNYRLWWAGQLERPLIQLTLTGHDPGRAEQIFALVTDMVSPQLSLEGEDTSMLLVKFCNGIMGSLATSWATEWPGPRFAVHGTEGSIISEEKGPLVVHSRQPTVEPNEGSLRVEVARHQYNKDWLADTCRLV